MADDTEERTQTTPKGAEIPVPTRDDVLADLRKVAKRPLQEDSQPGTPG